MGKIKTGTDGKDLTRESQRELKKKERTGKEKSGFSKWSEVQRESQ